MFVSSSLSCPCCGALLQLSGNIPNPVEQSKLAWGVGQPTKYPIADLEALREEAIQAGQIHDRGKYGTSVGHASAAVMSQVRKQAAMSNVVAEDAYENRYGLHPAVEQTGQGFAEPAEDDSDVRLCPEELYQVTTVGNWCHQFNIKIITPNGWKVRGEDCALANRISKKDFIDRAGTSVLSGTPSDIAAFYTLFMSLSKNA